MSESGFFCYLCDEEITQAEYEEFDGLCPECLDGLLPEEEKRLRDQTLVLE